MTQVSTKLRQEHSVADMAIHLSPNSTRSAPPRLPAQECRRVWLSMYCYYQEFAANRPPHIPVSRMTLGPLEFPRDFLSATRERPIHRTATASKDDRFANTLGAILNGCRILTDLLHASHRSFHLAVACSEMTMIEWQSERLSLWIVGTVISSVRPFGPAFSVQVAHEPREIRDLLVSGIGM